MVADFLPKEFVRVAAKLLLYTANLDATGMNWRVPYSEVVLKLPVCLFRTKAVVTHFLVRV